MKPVVPHLHIVVAFSALAVLGYAAFSIWVVLYSNDPALRGDTIGTWKSFGVLAFGFWLGSSSAGKAQEPSPSGRRDDPVNVTPVDELK